MTGPSKLRFDRFDVSFTLSRPLNSNKIVDGILPNEIFRNNPSYSSKVDNFLFEKYPTVSGGTRNITRDVNLSRRKNGSCLFIVEICALVFVFRVGMVAVGSTVTLSECKGAFSGSA